MQGRHPRHGLLVCKVQPVKLVEERQTIQAYLKVETPAVEEAENLRDENSANLPLFPHLARKSWTRPSMRHRPHLQRQTLHIRPGSA